MGQTALQKNNDWRRCLKGLPKAASVSSMNSAWAKKNRQEHPITLKKTQKWESQPTTRDRGLGCEQYKAYLLNSKKDTAGPLASGAHKANIEGMVGLSQFALRSIPHCPPTLFSDMGKLILTGCITLTPISPGFPLSVTRGDADRTQGKGKKESRGLLSYFASDNISSKDSGTSKLQPPTEGPLQRSPWIHNTASSLVPLGIM